MLRVVVLLGTLLFGIVNWLTVYEVDYGQIPSKDIIGEKIQTNNDHA